MACMILPRELYNFNSRPSARGDGDGKRVRRNERHFNSRPSARGDADVQGCLRHCVFQFTPLREGRPKE